MILDPAKIKSFSSRILEKPYSVTFYNSTCDFFDTLCEDANCDFSNLNDHEKFALFVYCHTRSDLAVFKRTCMKYFQWTSYKIRKIIKEINQEQSPFYIECVATFSEDTGLISGKGYLFGNGKEHI